MKLTVTVLRAAFVSASFISIFYFFPTYQVWSEHMHGFAVESFRPVGISRLTGFLPSEMFPIIYGTLIVSGILTILGFVTRISYSVFLLASLVQFSNEESFLTWGWSHGYNAMLLAQIGLWPILWLEPGHQWFRKRIVNRREAPSDSQSTVVAWMVWALAFNVSMMFLSALVNKLHTSGLHWAFSDNMRNILVGQYQFMNRPMPDWIATIANHQFLYQGVAFSNLVVQAAPFVLAFSGAHRLPG